MSDLRLSAHADVLGFLRRHEPRLRDIERLKLPLASMRKRSDAQKTHDQEVFQITRRMLGAGQRLTTTAFTGG